MLVAVWFGQAGSPNSLSNRADFDRIAEGSRASIPRLGSACQRLQTQAASKIARRRAIPEIEGNSGMRWEGFSLQCAVDAAGKLNIPASASKLVDVQKVTSQLTELQKNELILVGVERTENESNINGYQIESLLGLLRTKLYELGQQGKVYAPFSALTDSKVPIEFLWVENFPLFEFDQQGHIKSTHHPFTSPLESISANALREMKDPAKWMQLKSKSCDLVLNGNEVGGG